MKKAMLLALSMLLGFHLSAHAEDIPTGLRAALDGAGIKPERIAESGVSGLYEISVGTNLAYVSADGRYLLRGELIDIKEGFNLTKERQRGLRRAILEGLDERQMVVFSGDNPQHTVTVFTDVDCGYCAKLHRELADYYAQGIRIRYLAYPRAGPESGSARKMVSVWCAANPHEAMTRAKAGREVEQADCENPVANQYALGAQFGLRGTPTIVLETGDVIGGYAPAKDLLQAILQAKAG
jgi:thiol:disulfide interchange protein DsbC